MCPLLLQNCKAVSFSSLLNFFVTSHLSEVSVGFILVSLWVVRRVLLGNGVPGGEVDLDRSGVSSSKWMTKSLSDSGRFISPTGGRRIPCARRARLVWQG